ncbi:ribbon-helix-helix domain-containing protein [Azospirillum sp. A39]|uniref:ribbon-helix-helix domain-containing protein n=1 Tax=Azospirillum sp. A39 TaxID=3462279 RepID=UPI004045C497
MRKVTPVGGEIGFLSDLMTQATSDVPVSRTVLLGGQRVSVRLEASIWDGLIDIGERQAKAVEELCAEIEARRAGIPLSTAIRVFVLQYFRERTEAV